MVAEGVEEDAVRLQLTEMGCDVAQGFLSPGRSGTPVLVVAACAYRPDAGGTVDHGSVPTVRSCGASNSCTETVMGMGPCSVLNSGR